MTRTDAETTRARLLDVADELLAAKGIRATTMSTVAERAAVSRAWLYRLFPDKNALVGASLIRMVETSWERNHAELAAIDGFENRLVAGVQIGRRAYDDPGATLMRLRTAEPEEFAAAIGVGVAGLVPDLAAFWRRYLVAAVDDGEIHPDTDIDEAAEWVARVLISLGSIPGNRIDADDPESVRRHFRRYVLPALRSRPAH
ncbi:putative TetR family transcriptional regulator [Gordonia araii NBRC 100433]|uniref:Putative TetR family transcriptional regulator n=1 Tax=Gordonia araii NBRC 100433 TaxID=1073574 RepID=G7H149_9ACTN|nr:TetR/AcrR family transcriptional regulator [Gordonia araii]NNG96704.1 TetR/AcrR family transcriptional regulator [Gordonia araii NBRC 100433]GAB09610.1 putative TetR family transcriptional regulator [Gordonia araii NBRC 100433]